MSVLLDGFAAVLTPENLLFAVIGVTVGTLVGVLPGIGPALTIALLLPLTFSLDSPTGALIMFAGIYAGAMYGGSTTSILLNTPASRRPWRRPSRGTRWPAAAGHGPRSRRRRSGPSWPVPSRRSC
ncbi:hypothetical protein Psuf_092430 [Phytohabitans suffuscus]|uniref:DUF112 domain-containing protein n=1 Tax=Phytohabitans suffuscus TaxID=624315 RepID=A0A6F8Z0H2_9ACTN|nr:tripartite tricarboxylate transporter permease [Phytohabitans suffuscus]BCB91930.1 hypothetical protein Psuf_092430 [Phytohabitans suffuscus]